MSPVKIPKVRKRKSNEMKEDLVKCGNKKNYTPRDNMQFPVSEHKNSSMKKDQRLPYVHHLRKHILKGAKHLQSV